MLRPLLLHAALGLMAAGSATAQVYSGVFAAPNDQGGQTVVTLQQAGQRVTGTIVGPGARFQLEGVLEDGSVVGSVTGGPGGLWFEAELDGADLYLTLVGAGADGKPDFDQATTLAFARQGDAAAGEGATPLGENANPLAVPRAAPSPSAAGSDAGSLDDGTPLGREWAQFLAGKKATKMSSYSSGSAGGYSSRTDVHLCPNGQFALRGSDLVTVDVGDAGGYSGGNSGGQGTWHIITQGNLAGIELRYAGGQVEQHRLDYQDTKTYVDGERWLITPSEVCGGY